MAIGVHSMTMDMSGRFLEVVVNGAKGGCYVWEWATNNITAVTTATSGHIVLGYGVRINQSGCPIPAKGTSDAYGWTLRKLSAPNTDLVQLTDPPAGTPTWGEDGHLSWANVKPGNKEPVLGSLYRDTWALVHPWRFWDDEIIGIATDGSKTVWRFAHHHSVYHNFSDSPRGNASQDGKFYAFTSNWEDSLGKDRRDVFVVELPLTVRKASSPAAL
jgi:hypothetical protein